ncbi:SDR family oxidoreductase [Lactiplantibacillus mudanjiangensis]|uniref:Nucleoside-diphosphate-sugar epimerase [Lactobacillus brevis ATCC 367] n=1 Tax=Lactiplantibacillus mudanjiangensis TaxID=1296538 RepID=A0A660DU25_9LACO|nr:aldehyde reductase [Lactiplantibacillus mudanjiangensis]VDG22751.1 Nucleoside-diphosphate-sugar epimerase [Lactobacillus brevis ATCC 367] [Lactiplantibacillus mudanjiangensis]VDG26682.1 Nucleoside-diphosphate-sugar epimerase [Lactobacillus brevis ATCC 367] [Lactiplantibacillus mudanjiangensis]VDG31911.1 Nucleoside-diphosphate-sugar epimerase [Lactobacillus brevis ATCC 367] [Lactiplantibacillus mudanjiangensis]
MNNQNAKPLVVVTGGSGFIAIHIILQLLQQGYAVRATVRSLKKRPVIEAMLRQGGLTDFQDLSLIEADLTHDTHWANAMQDATYVMHVASPTPKLNFKNEAEMIQPAVDGVLRVLTAARDAHVKRVVLTSAYGAIFAGHPHRTTPYTEADWSNLDAKNIHPYQKSKTLAERAAWDFIKREGDGLELAAVNPVGVMGPVLASDYSHSNVQIQQLLDGDVKAVPQVDSGYIDVRDVASLHLLAMTQPQAAGERFLATTGETLSMLDVANLLRAAYSQYADRLPQKVLPNAAVKAAALVKPQLRMLATLVGGYAETSNAKAVKLLGWHPRSAKTAILATAQSMIDLNLVKPI